MNFSVIKRLNKKLCSFLTKETFNLEIIFVIKVRNKLPAIELVCFPLKHPLEPHSFRLFK